MKRWVMQKIFEILPAIFIVLGLLVGSSAHLSLPPSAQGSQDQKAPYRAGAAATSDGSPSRQETDSLSRQE